MMLNNENIICISSIDWDFIWQGHQEIMSEFARNGNRILFIENTGIRSPNFGDISRLKKRVMSWVKSTKGFRKEEENIFIFSPIVLPFPYSKIASWINKRLLIEPLKRWIRAMSFHSPIVWTFLPTTIALDIINEVYDKKALVYYDIADFSALTDNAKKLKKTEEIVIKKCDIVFAQGKDIADKCRKFSSNVHIFPFGVNTKVFEDFLDSSSKMQPADIKNIKRPIIGYVGGIHKHVDISLINYMAKSHPEWSVVLVGPKQVETRELDETPNIFALGKKKFEELPAYIDRFDVCTIPYLVSDYTKTVYPTKLNEYYIMGKPVVSTALPEVKSMNKENGNITSVASTHEEFVGLIEKALSSDSAKMSSERIAVARKNGWGDRIDRMSLLIEEVMERKKHGSLTKWQDKFLVLYKKTKNNMIKAFALALAAYLLIFYTPVIWILAQPLVISEQPRAVDVIVVLGGGVGESGKAGQGYEERAAYAAELYNKGYARHIIFSSGYTNIFKETSVMKALAMSLGVPENAMIMENRATNTYQNALFTKELAIKERWNSIVLLSSPYHMLRASKVFAKIDGGISIFYVPIPKSSFYAHSVNGIFSKKISLSQIGGIVHEYLGIVYYWFKGYI